MKVKVRRKMGVEVLKDEIRAWEQWRLLDWEIWIYEILDTRSRLRHTPSFSTKSWMYQWYVFIILFISSRFEPVFEDIEVGEILFQLDFKFCINVHPFIHSSYCSQTLLKNCVSCLHPFGTFDFLLFLLQIFFFQNRKFNSICFFCCCYKLWKIS